MKKKERGESFTWCPHYTRSNLLYVGEKYCHLCEVKRGGHGAERKVVPRERGGDIWVPLKEIAEEFRAYFKKEKR